MKVFQDLSIYVGEERIVEFIQELENGLNQGWQRDIPSEERMNKLSVNGRYYCFECTVTDLRNAALLALFFDRKKLDVANIVPTKKTQLSYDEYNYILNEFYERLVIPASKKLSIHVTVSSADVYIEDMISTESMKKLRAFSDLGNKSLLHPLDRERWFDFLLAVHQEHRQLGYLDLKRWLIEEEKWPEDTASDLASEYAFAMELLDRKI